MVTNTPEARASTSAPTRSVGAFEPFRHRLFAACWWGSFAAHAAVWLQNITVPYLVFEMTSSATWLGVAAVAGQAPALVASPLGGVLADRYSRRGLLILTLVLKMMVSFGLYALWHQDLLQITAILGLLVLSAVAHTVHLACSSAFILQTVPHDSLAAAVRLNSIQVNLSRAMGPAIAGFVIAQFDAGGAFLTSGFAYLPFAVVLVFARPRPIESPPLQGTWSALLDGFRAIGASRALAVPVFSAGFVSFFGAGIQPLVAGLASDVYEVGAQGFGWLVSSMGISSAASGVVLAAINERARRSTMVRVGFLCYGAGAVLSGATSSYAIGIVGFTLIGVGHTFAYVSCATALQIHLSEDLRGRITALYMTAIFVGMPAGAQLGGFLGDLIGLPAVLIAYGLILGAYVLASRFTLRGFSDLDGEAGQAVIDGTSSCTRPQST